MQVTAARPGTRDHQKINSKKGIKNIGIVLALQLFIFLPKDAWSQCGNSTSACSARESTGSYLSGCYIGEKWLHKMGTYCADTVINVPNMSNRANNEGSIAIRTCPGQGNSSKKVILGFTGPWLDFTSRITVSGCSKLKFKKILETGVYNRLDECRRSFVVAEFTLEGGNNTCTDQKYIIYLYRPNTLGIGETHTKFRARND